MISQRMLEINLMDMKVQRMMGSCANSETTATLPLYDGRKLFASINVF
jgi:hypothetical protein